MNFEREFIKDIPYKKFKKGLGRDDALEYVHHLWAKCEAGKSDCIVLTDTEDLALLMDAPDGLTGEAILDAFIKSGILVETESLTYRAVVWAEQNAGLLSKWENGRKGGRPRKVNPTEANSGEEISREANSSGENKTEYNQTEGRETKQSEGNESKVKGPVSRSLTEDKPNPNPNITQSEPNGNLEETEKEPFVPTDWNNDSYENPS